MSGIHNSSSISFDPLSLKYSVEFGGNTIETVVTNKASIVNHWVNEIIWLYSKMPVAVGLNTEWSPHHSSNKTATLQLCVDEKCLIMQLFYMDSIPQSLKNFLLDPNFTFVGIGVNDDVKKLRIEYGLGCSKCEDIDSLAYEEARSALFGDELLGKQSLKDLAFSVAGLRIEKPRNVSNLSHWEKTALSAEQVKYACINAYASFRCGLILLNRNESW